MHSGHFCPEQVSRLASSLVHKSESSGRKVSSARSPVSVSFAQSLICRNGIPLTRNIDAGILENLLLLSDARPEAENPSLDPAIRVTYESRGGGSLTCRSPVTKLSLGLLKQAWPMPVAFVDLARQSHEGAVKAGFPIDAVAAKNLLSSDLLTAMGAGVVEWRTSPVAYTRNIGVRPAAGALARHQAAQGYRASNMRGEFITLDEIHRQTLTQLDGSRDAGEIAEALVGRLKAREFLLHEEGQKAPITDEARMRALLASALPKVLENLARQAFLLDSTDA